MSESRPPDDTPTRLPSEQVIEIDEDGNVHYPDELTELRAEVSRLQQENATKQREADYWRGLFNAADEDTAKALEENALLRRSLEMLAKQLDEKDAEITDLRFTIVRHNSPA
jgi:chromosome segregation ATPase